MDVVGENDDFATHARSAARAHVGAEFESDGLGAAVEAVFAADAHAAAASVAIGENLRPGLGDHFATEQLDLAAAGAAAFAASIDDAAGGVFDDVRLGDDAATAAIAVDRTQRGRGC